MAALVCSRCIHCCPLGLATDLQRENECRANPPTVQFFPTQSGQVVKVCGFPTVKDDSPACGLFEPKPEMLKGLKSIKIPE